MAEVGSRQVLTRPNSTMQMTRTPIASVPVSTMGRSKPKLVSTLTLKVESTAAVPIPIAALQASKVLVHSIEASRVLSSMDLLIRKMEIIAILSVSAAARASLPPAQRTLVEQYLTAENDFATIAANPASEEHEFVALETHLASISRALFRACHDQMPKILCFANETLYTPDMRSLLHTLKALRGRTSDQFVTSLEEERSRQEYVTGLITRESNTTLAIAQLTAQLSGAESEAAEMISKREVVADQLSAQIASLEISSARSIFAHEQSAADQAKGDLEAFVGHSKIHQGAAEAVNAKLKEHQIAHKISEDALRKRQAQLENELENNIKQYDGTMQDLQTEIDAINGDYVLEKEQLRELEARMEVLAVEYGAIMEERRVERELAEKTEAEFRRTLKAALLVQQFWRAYKCRKALKKAEAKSKGKGKGGDKPKSAKK